MQGMRAQQGPARLRAGPQPGPAFDNSGAAQRRDCGHGPLHNIVQQGVCRGRVGEFSLRGGSDAGRPVPMGNDVDRIGVDLRHVRRREIKHGALSLHAHHCGPAKIRFQRLKSGDARGVDDFSSPRAFSRDFPAPRCHRRRQRGAGLTGVDAGGQCVMDKKSCRGDRGEGRSFGLNHLPHRFAAP